MADLNPLRLDGRHILVTGASSGIGRRTALMLHALGASLSVVDRDEAGLASLDAELCAGKGVARQVADLSDIAGIEELVSRCVAAGGKLHGVVHCAGLLAIMPIRTLQIDGWRRIFAVNTEAALMLGKCLSSKKVYAGHHGSIVFISSVMGMVGSAGAVAYSMSKAALNGMARSLSLGLAPRGIRVNCIAPGFVRPHSSNRPRDCGTKRQERLSRICIRSVLAKQKTSLMPWRFLSLIPVAGLPVRHWSSTVVTWRAEFLEKA